MNPGLFDSSAAKAGTLVHLIKAEMAKSVESSGLSRDQVLDKLNELSEAAGVCITGGNSKALGRATLDKWLNPSEREHVPGLVALNVFCLALADPAPLAILLELHGFIVMSPADVKYRDYGKACLDEKEARRRKRQMEAQI